MINDYDKAMPFLIESSDDSCSFSQDMVKATAKAALEGN